MMGLVLPSISTPALKVVVVRVDLVWNADDRKKAPLSSVPLLLLLLLLATMQLCLVVFASAGRDDEDRFEWLPLPSIAIAADKPADESTPIVFLTILPPPLLLLDTPPDDSILARLPPMVEASCGNGLTADDDDLLLPPPLLPIAVELFAALPASCFLCCCWLPLIPLLLLNVWNGRSRQKIVQASVSAPTVKTVNVRSTYVAL